MDNKKEWDMYAHNEIEDSSDKQEKTNLEFYKECQEIVQESLYPLPKHQAFIDKYESYKEFRLESARNSFTKDLNESRLNVLEQIRKLQGGVK